MVSLTGYVLNFKFDYASFRRPYSTTSQSSYYLPSLSALKGMIAAILGFERDEYYKIFDGVLFGIKLNKKPEKFFINTNLLDTSTDFIPYLKYGHVYQRNPTRIEYVKDLDFDLYLIFDENCSFGKNLKIYDAILLRSKTNFTLYAGKSHTLGKYKFLRKAGFEMVPISSEFYVKTVVNPDLNKFVIKDNANIIIEKDIPYGFELDDKNSRILIPKSYQIYFTYPDKTLCIKSGNIFRSVSNREEEITVLNKE